MTIQHAKPMTPKSSMDFLRKIGISDIAVEYDLQLLSCVSYPTNPFRDFILTPKNEAEQEQIDEFTLDNFCEMPDGAFVASYELDYYVVDVYHPDTQTLIRADDNNYDEEKPLIKYKLGTGNDEVDLNELLRESYDSIPEYGMGTAAELFTVKLLDDLQLKGDETVYITSNRKRSFYIPQPDNKYITLRRFTSENEFYGYLHQGEVVPFDDLIKLKD